MKQTLQALPAAYLAHGHERRGMDDKRWSLLRLLVAAALTFAVLAAATGLAG